MRNVHLIKFSFGTNVHRNIPTEQLEYFAVFFSKFFNLEFSVKQEQQENIKTIPISYKRISNSSDILARKMLESLSNDSKLIDSDKKFESNNEDLIIIDIKSNLRNTTLLYLSNEIEKILKLDSNNYSPRFVILLENIPATIGMFSSIESFIKDGKVLLIDKKKRFKYKEEHVKVNKEFSFDLLSKSSLERTKFKLIRKIGHYGRYNDEDKQELVACNQFFYDGRDCIEDISDLLFEKVSTLKEISNFDTTKIIFDCPESPWLAESIILLDSDLRTLKNDYSLSYNNFLNISEIKETYSEKESILFIVDLIHTATVFKKWYNFLTEKFPNSEIKAISILVSDTDSTYITLDQQIAEIEVRPENKVFVDFFLLVNQTRHERFGICPMCNELHMEIIKDSSFINENILTSYEAWVMCDESGYDKEDFITDRVLPYPNQVPILPKRLELIKENSAYLALKYKKHIEKNNLLESPDLILVFPDERTSKKELDQRQKPIEIEDTASGYFAETLMQLKEIEYFGIPRNILDKINIGKDIISDLTFIKNEHNEFYKKLLLLPEDIIIMDEFGLSGTTLLKIIAVLDMVKKKPKAYFPIFNFNPKVLSKKKKKNYEVLSLYNFNLKVN